MPPEVSDEKVNCCYMGNRHDSFNAMNPQQDVKHPTRYVAAEKNGIVQNQPGSSEKGYAPEDGQVVKLFPISPSIEPWRFLHAQKPTDMLKRLKKIFLAGEYRIWAVNTFGKAPPVNVDENVYCVNAL